MAVEDGLKAPKYLSVPKSVTPPGRLAEYFSQIDVFLSDLAKYQHPSSASHKQREDGIKGIGG